MIRPGRAFGWSWHPPELEFATIEAAGLTYRSGRGYWVWNEAATTLRSAVKFEDGAIVQYGAADGGPLEVGWVGTYRLLDEHTIEALENQTLDRVVYEFMLRDGILTMDVVHNDSPVDLVPQTGSYETMPFTKVP